MWPVRRLTCLFIFYWGLFCLVSLINNKETTIFNIFTLIKRIFDDVMFFISPHSCTKKSMPILPLSQPAILEADQNGEKNKMFILDTSGKARLSPRAACAVESAAENSGLFILVMMLSPVLDLTDNTTCQVYKKYSSKNVRFYRIVPKQDFSGTPLINFDLRINLTKTNFSVVHLSDALRIAYIFQYGGWYADIDFIFMRSVVGMENILTINARNKRADTLNGTHITNAILNLEKNHVLAVEYMMRMVKNYSGRIYNEIGPLMLSRTVRSLCNYPLPKPFIRINNEEYQCYGLTVVGREFFCPYRAYQARRMWHRNHTRPKSWNQMVGNASAVHFYGRISRDRIVSRNAKKDLYSYLAPKFCPISYHSSPDFT